MLLLVVLRPVTVLAMDYNSYETPKSGLLVLWNSCTCINGCERGYLGTAQQRPPMDSTPVTQLSSTDVYTTHTCSLNHTDADSMPPQHLYSKDEIVIKLTTLRIKYEKNIIKYKCDFTNVCPHYHCHLKNESSIYTLRWASLSLSVRMVDNCRMSV